MQSVRFALLPADSGTVLVATGTFVPSDADRLAAICASLPFDVAALRIDLSRVGQFEAGALERVIRFAALWRARCGREVSLSYVAAPRPETAGRPLEIEITASAPTPRAPSRSPFRRRRAPFKLRTAPWPRLR